MQSTEIDFNSSLELVHVHVHVPDDTDEFTATTLEVRCLANKVGVLAFDDSSVICYCGANNARNLRTPCWFTSNKTSVLTALKHRPEFD